MTNSVETVATPSAETSVSVPSPKTNARTAGTAMKASKVAKIKAAKSVGLTYAEYVANVGRETLGIGGGPKGSPVNVRPNLPKGDITEVMRAGRIEVTPVLPADGPDAPLATLNVVIPQVGTFPLPFQGERTILYVQGLFRRYGVLISSGTNAADSNRTAVGVTAKCAGGDPSIWRRPGFSQGRGGTITLDDATLAGLLEMPVSKLRAQTKGAKGLAAKAHIKG